MKEIISQLEGKIIASSQAYPGEPMRHPETMAQISLACEQGGAAAIRCQGLADIAAIKGQVHVPVIGLWKENMLGFEDIYITPTLRHARCCVYAGSDIVAIDATDKARPDGLTFEQTVSELKKETIVMADCGCIDDIKRALYAGCEIVSTTLAWYFGDRPKTEGPDLEFLEESAKLVDDKAALFCEGRIHSPKDAQDAFNAGAFAVVVGTAITHPTSITSWFVDAVK